MAAQSYLVGVSSHIVSVLQGSDNAEVPSQQSGESLWKIPWRDKHLTEVTVRWLKNAVNIRH